MDRQIKVEEIFKLFWINKVILLLMHLLSNFIKSIRSTFSGFLKIKIAPIFLT